MQANHERENTGAMMIELGATRVSRGLFACIAGLVVAYVATQTGKLGFGHELQLGFVRLFDLDGECTAPSFFSALQLTAAAVLLGVIARFKRRAGDRMARSWTILAAGFAAMAVDEACALHEMIQLRGLGAGADPWVAAVLRGWVVLGLAVVGMAGAAMVPLLRALPAATRRRFLLAGAIFVGGAVGLEIVGAKLIGLYGADSVPYVTEVLAEETMEMTAIALFIRALLHYFAEEYGGLRVRFPGRGAGGER